MQKSHVVLGTIAALMTIATAYLGFQINRLSAHRWELEASLSAARTENAGLKAQLAMATAPKPEAAPVQENFNMHALTMYLRNPTWHVTDTKYDSVAILTARRPDGPYNVSLLMKTEYVQTGPASDDQPVVSTPTLKAYKEECGIIGIGCYKIKIAGLDGYVDLTYDVASDQPAPKKSATKWVPDHTFTDSDVEDILKSADIEGQGD